MAEVFNKNIGPCRVIYGTDDLGQTEGDVRLNVSLITADSKTNEGGDHPRHKYLLALTATVLAPLAEATVTILSKVVPGSSLSTGRLALKNSVGLDLVGLVKTLTLKPVIGGVVSTTASEWVVLPRATVEPQWDVAYSRGTQKIYPCLFTSIPVTAEDIATAGALYDLGYAVDEVVIMGATA
jgi:hypothetical protein